MGNDRNDRRTPSRDTARQPDISYPSADLDHPRIVIRRTGNAGEKPATFLSEILGYIGFKLVAQKSSPGDGLTTNIEEVSEKLPGTLLTGQRYDRATGLVSRYTEYKDTAIDALTVAGEVTPIDANLSEVRIESPPSSEDILDYFTAGPCLVNIQFPQVLTGITVAFNKSEGNGSNTNDGGAAASSGTKGGLNFSPSASAQGSASIIPDVTPIYAERPEGDDVPAIEWHFTLAMSEGSIPTVTTVCTRLSELLGLTVHPPINYRTKPITLVVRGQHVSLSASASSHHSDQWSPDNLSASVDTGKGASRENGVTSNTLLIGPTLHAAFNLTHALGSIASDTLTYTAVATVSATANLPAIVGSGDAPSFVAVENTTDTIGAGPGFVHTPISSTATASVSPAAIPGTTITAIPVTGTYLQSPLGFSPSQWLGYIDIHAVTVDYAYFA